MGLMITLNMYQSVLNVSHVLAQLIFTHIREIGIVFLILQVIQ